MTAQFRILLGAAAALAVAVPQASAQMTATGTGGNFVKSDNEAKLFAPQEKPRGLPGARTVGRGSAAPSERSAADMTPNEALFDAINRGDVSGARDALSRGASLDDRNILGLTALDLAIDLGRNDMTFMLLSMRGATSVGGPPPQEARSAKPARQVAERPTPAKVERIVPPAPVPKRQNTAAADGTPVPSAGFLGFGTPTVTR